MATDHIVGIDLGTTNSLVAFMQGDSPVVIPGDDGSHLVPSVVALDRNGQAIVGNAARNSLIETPERAIYSVKRLMGRGGEDIQQELKLFPFRLAEDLQAGEVLRIKLGERTFTPPEISGFKQHLIWLGFCRVERCSPFMSDAARVPFFPGPSSTPHNEKACAWRSWKTNSSNTRPRKSAWCAGWARR